MPTKPAQNAQPTVATPTTVQAQEAASTVVPADDTALVAAIAALVEEARDFKQANPNTHMLRYEDYTLTFAGDAILSLKHN